MKDVTWILIAMIMLIAACNNYIVPQHDPAVLDSSIELSGEVTGDFYPEVRTMKMRISGQARNFLLLEVYGMEACKQTRTAAVKDSLIDNDIYLELVESETDGGELNYRNVRLFVGPFEKNSNYTLHFIESINAIRRDTLSYTFDYLQSIDDTVYADDYYYTLTDMPFCNIQVRAYTDNQVSPESRFNTPTIDGLGFPDFFETDSGLLIHVILSSNIGLDHSASFSLNQDTLFLKGQMDPPTVDMSEEFYYFEYLIRDYQQQIFYYNFKLNNADWALHEGWYNR